jgi:hypothetical protein
VLRLIHADEIRARREQELSDVARDHGKQLKLKEAQSEGVKNRRWKEKVLKPSRERKHYKR